VEPAFTVHVWSVDPLIDAEMQKGQHMGLLLSGSFIGNLSMIPAVSSDAPRFTLAVCGEVSW